ncbi:hypothetical protein EYZ11_000134 [Aspergillus tanneri]|uniref:Uncharacterized protein n=1 Tax=Aspergillus tanneri TaxID=1220188 RepID=A0A4S3JXX5_9EURO|nr:hypothetical protein EYZ11_000134 [Aspergillus tanneri]
MERDRSSTSTGYCTPLAEYFDPYTSLLYDHLLDPALPPTPRWEWELRQRIDEGKGLGAWRDRLVERIVRWLQGVQEAV